ncbi:hypothetical protein ACPCA8_23410 [Streptomyces capoamus]|uniref:hypothetical protein n=1 Tax=Streptomyces capoamus TaxID=68183 RepID=UPI003C309567
MPNAVRRGARSVGGARSVIRKCRQAALRARRQRDRDGARGNGPSTATRRRCHDPGLPLSAYMTVAPISTRLRGRASRSVAPMDEGEPTLPTTFTDYAREYELSVAQTVSSAGWDAVAGPFGQYLAARLT